MPEGSVITEEMRAAIGVESEPATYEVTTTGVRMFARAVGYTDPVFYDEASARSQGYPSLLAPPGYLGTRAHDPRSADSWLNLGFANPYKRILNGGNDLEYFAPVFAGDALSSTTRVADLRERTGSIGAMLIATLETTYRKADGQAVAAMRNTLIFY